MRYSSLGLLFSILMLMCKFAFAASSSPVGIWQTIDDETGKPRSLVKIVQLANGELAGRVIQVNYFKGEAPSDVCNLCAKTDPRYNQKNLGLIILTHLKPTANPLVFDDGEVLDPHNGKTYDAKTTLSANGDTLTLRGYIGISLLGRSQTWTRVDEEQFTHVVGKPIKTETNGVIETDEGKFLAPYYDSDKVIQQAFNQVDIS